MDIAALRQFGAIGARRACIADANRKRARVRSADFEKTRRRPPIECELGIFDGKPGGDKGGALIRVAERRNAGLHLVAKLQAKTRGDDQVACVAQFFLRQQQRVQIGREEHRFGSRFGKVTAQGLQDRQLVVNVAAENADRRNLRALAMQIAVEMLDSADEAPKIIVLALALGALAVFGPAAWSCGLDGIAAARPRRSGNIRE